MARKLVFGLKRILMGVPENDGGMSTTLTEVFGATVLGTANITTADATTTNIKAEESDANLISISTAGDKTMGFSTMNFDPDGMLFLFGGTLTGTAPKKTWHAPALIGSKILSVRFEDTQDTFVNLPKVNVTPKLGVKFDKSSAGQIDVADVILQPDKVGVSDIIMGYISAGV